MLPRFIGSSLRGAVLWLAVMLLSGCFLLPTGGRPTAARGGGLSPLGRGLRDFRVAFHCHSHLSHDSTVSFQEIAGATQALGFNAVVLNDHYVPGNIARSPHGLWDGILFIPGVELRPDPLPDGSRDRGSLLAFGLERDFDPQRPRTELTRHFKAGGALVAAGHCESFAGWGRYPVDAYEVYNLHAQFKLASRSRLLLGGLFLFPDAFFEAQVAPPRSVLDGYDARLREGERLSPLAGHDAHANVRPFGRRGPILGTYRELLRLFSNHVLAPELSAAGLLEGIRRGRVYVSFDFLGDGSSFAMTYGPGDREAEAILGEEAKHRPDSVLRIEAPAEGLIRVFRDGAPWREVSGLSFASPVPGPGIYRAEVDRGDRWGRRRLWIISAPIYVREAKP